MIELNEPALHYAVEMCRLYDNYKVVIVTPRINHTKVRNKVLVDLVGNNEISKIMPDYIIMKNGSSIRWLPYSENSARGYKCHLLIVDPIVETADKNVYRALEILKMNEEGNKI